MKTLYGWIAVPATRQTGLLDIHGNPLEEQLENRYKKQFTHAPGDTVHGAPKYGARWVGKEPKTLREMRRVAKAKPQPYKVWTDRSLRRVDKLIRKQL
jgi:ABC-type thiamine transport system substrate-binding protein